MLKKYFLKGEILKMKKILSIVLAAMMILSMLSVCALAVSADEAAPGEWEMHLDAFEESKLEEDPSSVTLSTPGYKYTDNGFETVNPVYQNAQAKYTVISKNKVDATNFSIKIQLDEFDVSGDAWLSFSFWSEKNGLAQGGNSDGTYGYGWSSLVKDAPQNGKTDGKLNFIQGFSCGNSALPGGWSHVGGTTEEFTPNEVDGKAVIEFKVAGKMIYINGTALSNANNVALNNSFKSDNGLAYFGISVKSGMKDTPVKFTILEVNGVKPTGSDSAEPINRGKTYGDMQDASSIPANTPGVLFDGTLRGQNGKLPSSSMCTTNLKEDGSIEVTSTLGAGYITFIVNSDYSVDVKDFPYIAIVVKNFCTCEREEGVPMAETCLGEEFCRFYYCAGNYLAPDDEHMLELYFDYMVDVTPEGSEDYYTMFYQRIDTEEFADAASRIHSLRFDYTQMGAGQSFDIVFAGYFRNPEDMANYTAGREEGFQIDPTDVFPDAGVDTCPECGAELNEDGECPYCVKDPGDDTSDTTTRRPSSTKKEEPSGGCGSVVGVGAIAIVLCASVAGLVTFKKRKND